MNRINQGWRARLLFAAACVLFSAAAAGADGGTGAASATTSPSTSSAPQGAKPQMAKPQKHNAAVPSEQQIDINHASEKQLKTLPGIGDAEAKKIVAGRPYKSKADLVTKNVLPEGLYISIRYRIIAIPDAKPKSKK